ncbi:hypothetical protein MMC13_001827 [Lambiella insularis]|nr:hypothetical protein [Lambiella insularis]
MDEDYHFKASRKQYNTKIAQWRIGKNIKENEMKAIVRKERQRKMQDPPKDSVFRVRKLPVDSQKIERFKRDNRINSDDDISMLDAGTPSDVSCDTPRPEIHVLPAEDPRITPENDHEAKPVWALIPIEPYVRGELLEKEVQVMEYKLVEDQTVRIMDLDMESLQGILQLVRALLTLEETGQAYEDFILIDLLQSSLMSVNHLFLIACNFRPEQH